MCGEGGKEKAAVSVCLEGMHKGKEERSLGTASGTRSGSIFDNHLPIFDNQITACYLPCVCYRIWLHSSTSCTSEVSHMSQRVMFVLYPSSKELHLECMRTISLSQQLVDIN